MLDPDGRPLAGAQPRGLSDWWDSWSRPLPAAEFEVTGLAPGDVRQLAFLHRERRLSGSVILRGKVQGLIEVKLAVGHSHRPARRCERPAPGRRRARLASEPEAKARGGPRVPARACQDRCRRPLPARGPGTGLKYELQILGNGGFYGAVFKDLTIKAGENRDLGDVMNLDG